MMKKIHFLLLISLLLAACSDDDKEKQPAFVTNITISDAGKTFNPGDAVTVKADGLQSGDQIILDIYWPIADNPLFPEGYSRYTRAVTTEQTTNSITFLAPGHWPASRVEMFLERAGQLQPLGQISVADGQSPEEPYLYGITNSHAIYTPTVPRGTDGSHGYCPHRECGTVPCRLYQESKCRGPPFPCADPASPGDSSRYTGYNRPAWDSAAADRHIPAYPPGIRTAE